MKKIVRPIKTLIRQISLMKNIVCSKIRFFYFTALLHVNLYTYIIKHKYSFKCSLKTSLACLNFFWCSLSPYFPRFCSISCAENVAKRVLAIVTIKKHRKFPPICIFTQNTAEISRAPSNDLQITVSAENSEYKIKN